MTLLNIHAAATAKRHANPLRTLAAFRSHAGSAGIISRSPIGLGAVLLTSFYLAYYLTNVALPRHPLLYRRGWWSWWDQSQYLASAAALARHDFSPVSHWYPLGYSIVATPFVHLFPAHPFFLVDLAALLGAYAGYLVVADRLGIQPVLAVAVFLFTTFADPRLAGVWVEPWNTTLSAALIWGLLGVAADILKRPRALPPGFAPVFLLGLFASAMPLVRPTDAALSAVALGWIGLAALLRGWITLRALAALALGCAVLTLPYAVLYLHIYGPHPTTYMLAERGTGFVPGRLGWKLYEILLAPRPWFPTGVSLFARFPWLVLSFAGMLLLAIRPPRPPNAGIFGLMAALIAISWLISIAYIDLLPSSLWLYNNIHYLKWTFPGMGLLALWLLRQMVARQTRACAVAALLAVLIVSMVRLIPIPIPVPVPAQARQPVDMVQLPGLRLAWTDAYFGAWRFADAGGPIIRPLSVRVLPDRQGVRLLPQWHALRGAVVWLNRPAGQGGAAVSWGAKLTLGYPCWLPPYPCDHMAPGD